MSRNIRQRADGAWVSKGKVLASPMFYGDGWQMRDGFLTMRSGAKCPKRAYRKLRERLLKTGTLIVVGDDWVQSHAFFSPSYARKPCWVVTVTTFAPSATVEVVCNA